MTNTTKTGYKFRKWHLGAAFVAAVVVTNAINPAPEMTQAEKDARMAEFVARELERDTERKCEAKLMAKLRSPSSYKKVAVDHLPWGDKHSVTITYEAVNAFNAPVRNQEVCRYTVG